MGDTAVDPDPDWKFNASPPPWLAAAVMLLSLACVLASRITVLVAVELWQTLT